MPENIEIKDKNKDKVDRKQYKFDFDELKMFFSEPYVIKMENNKYIEIRQPSIGEILELGDREVYSCITPFITNTTSYRTQLWDMGVDWNKVTDYELFLTLTPHIKGVEFLFKKLDFIKNPDYDDNFSEEKNLEFGNEKYIRIYKDIDFSKLNPYVDTRTDNSDNDLKKIVLYDKEQDIVINEETYIHIREYLRMMFDQHPKEEFAKGKLAKQWIIDEEKEKNKLENEKNKGKRKSVLLPMVSSLLNHPGFKYDLDGIKKLGIFAFMDSVRRLQVYEQCIAFMGGMYSGMMDTSKLGQEELNKRLNWLQDIYEE